jgi:hypothetical protein
VLNLGRGSVQPEEPIPSGAGRRWKRVSWTPIEGRNVQSLSAFLRIGTGEILHPDDRQMRNRPDLGMCLRYHSRAIDRFRFFPCRHTEREAGPGEQIFLACHGCSFRRFGRAKLFSPW